MSRTIVFPVIAGVAYVLKQLAGIEIGEELQNQITDFVILGVFVGTALLTSFRTRKKKKE
jgi:hypothetical protein